MCSAESNCCIQDLYSANSLALPIQKRRPTDKPIVEPVKEGIEINVLIASDIYYSVVKDGIIRLNNGTVAVETKVGYLVCGGRPNVPQIDRYFTTSPTAPKNTSKNHSSSSNGYRMSPTFFKQKLIS